MFDRIRKIFRNTLTGLTKPAAWFIDFVSGGKSDSGIRVTGKEALGLPAVWYAISKISGHVAQLPLVVHRRLENGGAEKATTHPAYRLMKTRPNRFQTISQFKECLMVHGLLWGNGKAAILRRGNRPDELILIDPTKSSTVYWEGEKWHVVQLDEQEEPLAHRQPESAERIEKMLAIPDRDVLHIPGLGVDGLNGLELFEVGKNSLGLAMAQQKAANKDFANGSKPSVLIEAPRGMFQSEQDAQKFIANFNNWHQGLDNYGRAGLIRENMKVHTLSLGADAAQWVEQRNFQRQEIAILFCLESILGDDNSVSYNSLEQKNLAYLSNCLMKWLVRIEEECDEKLLSGRQKRFDTHFWKFNTAALLRADFKTTVEALGIAITHRIMSPNEARMKLDMNPIQGQGMDEFSNPAITPGEGEQSGNDSESESDSGSGSDSENINTRALISHLRHMMQTECNRVLFAAGKGNYLNFLDKFYKQWQARLETVLVDLGGSREIAEKHCRESKHALVELAGCVTQDGLADAVSELIESWPDRAVELAHEILKEELCNA